MVRTIRNTFSHLPQFWAARKKSPLDSVTSETLPPESNPQSSSLKTTIQKILPLSVLQNFATTFCVALRDTPLGLLVLSVLLGSLAYLSTLARIDAKNWKAQQTTPTTWISSVVLLGWREAADKSDGEEKFLHKAMQRLREEIRKPPEIRTIQTQTASNPSSPLALSEQQRLPRLFSEEVKGQIPFIVGFDPTATTPVLFLFEGAAPFSDLNDEEVALGRITLFISDQLLSLCAPLRKNHSLTPEQKENRNAICNFKQIQFFAPHFRTFAHWSSVLGDQKNQSEVNQLLTRISPSSLRRDPMKSTNPKPQVASPEYDDQRQIQY